MNLAIKQSYPTTLPLHLYPSRINISRTHASLSPLSYTDNSDVLSALTSTSSSHLFTSSTLTLSSSLSNYSSFPFTASNPIPIRRTCSSANMRA